MADRFELTCPSCRQAVEVGPPQAGSFLTCRCGEQIEVPPFRAMRELPIVDPVEKTTASTWGFRQGLIASGLILTVATAIPGLLWQLGLSTTTSHWFDSHLQQTIQELDTEPPLATWFRWHHRIVPLAERGLSEIQTPALTAFENRLKRRSMYRFIAFTVSGCAALGTLIAVITNRSARDPHRRRG